MTVHYFLECLLSFTYINSVIHGSFYFIDLKKIPEFTFLDIFTALYGRKRYQHFAGDTYILHQYRSNFAHTSDFYILVSEI